MCQQQVLWALSLRWPASTLNICQQVLQPGSDWPAPSPISHQRVQQPTPVRPSSNPHVNWWVSWSNLSWTAPSPGSHSCQCVLCINPSQPTSQTQLTHMPMGTATQSGLACSQSQLLGSPAGDVPSSSVPKFSLYQAHSQPQVLCLLVDALSQPSMAHM